MKPKSYDSVNADDPVVEHVDMMLSEERPLSKKEHTFNLESPFVPDSQNKDRRKVK